MLFSWNFFFFSFIIEVVWDLGKFFLVKSYSYFGKIFFHAFSISTDLRVFLPKHSFSSCLFEIEIVVLMNMLVECTVAVFSLCFVFWQIFRGFSFRCSCFLTIRFGEFHYACFLYVCKGRHCGPRVWVLACLSCTITRKFTWCCCFFPNFDWWFKIDCFREQKWVVWIR